MYKYFLKLISARLIIVPYILFCSFEPMANSNIHINSEEFSNTDKDFENAIRPAAIDDFSGQPQLIENLTIFIKAAKIRGEALDHVLFHGPPGLGKTTLSRIVANELGVNIKETSGPVIENRETLPAY